MDRSPTGMIGWNETDKIRPEYEGHYEYKCMKCAFEAGPSKVLSEIVDIGRAHQRGTHPEES